MSGLSKSEKDECLKITEKLLSWPICAPFVLMDNPEPVDSPLFYQKIREKPLSLYEIKVKLTINIYNTVKEWEDDVNSIWSKAESYYGRTNTTYALATEASNWFHETMDNRRRIEKEEYLRKNLMMY